MVKDKEKDSQLQGIITKEEQRLITQFRARLKLYKESPYPKLEGFDDEENQDMFLVRWLRARDLILDDAEAALNASMKWRKENDVDSVLIRELDPLIRDTYHIHFPGTDKYGNPIMLLPFSEYDLRKVVNAKKFKEFEVFSAYFFESVQREICKANLNRPKGLPPINGLTMIADASKYPYGQLMNMTALKTKLGLATVYEENYPKILYKVFVINAPSYFNIFISVLKKFAGKTTIDKITSYSNVRDWQKDIASYMDPAIIPVRYGGHSQRTDMG